MAIMAVVNAPSMMPPSAPRLNWFAENMMHTARPVKMMGIIEARMSVRRLNSKTVPFLPMRNKGPSRSWRSASPVVFSFSVKLLPSALMKMSSIATSSAIQIATRPRTSEKTI